MPKTRDLPSKKEEECARKKLIELLKIKEDKIQHSNSEYNGLHVHDHEFDFFALQELLNFEFKYEIVFINCKFKDIESFNTYETKHNFLIFQKCKFDSKIIESDLTVQNVSILNNKFLFFACEFNGNIDIGKVTFSDEIKFSDYSFKDMVKLDIKASLNNIEFDSCLFEKEVDLQGSIFEKEVYFTNCYFKNTTNFSHCKFKNIASFYNSTFEKVPNFSASYFKEQKAVNLINVNVDKISFKSIEKYVENNYKKDKYYKKELEEIKSNENKNKLKQKLDKKYKRFF
ncbi:MAG TPA: pentapeptide repeat-containing protein [Campylobacter avium]|uniref:pentapeptide repeat-containing protein n=1 Tax=Campylobacter avium TaxID=522485 RepID=UPI001E046409|nr:pentapeptide repeat-containing protein [Campylobacter avium]HJE65646.1 pentapeptide repeat-containing protein [Campylobacter avium]